MIGRRSHPRGDQSCNLLRSKKGDKRTRDMSDRRTAPRLASVRQEEPFTRRSFLRGTEQRIFNLVWKAKTPDQWSMWLRFPLQQAALAGDLGLVKRLLKAGADTVGFEELLSNLLLASPDTKDDNGDSTIHFAAALAHDQIVEVLLARGANKDALDSEGRAPLHLAVGHGCLAAAKALLAAGSDVGLRYTGNDCAALDLAAINGDVHMLKVLLRHGANVNAADSRGYTALHRAAFHNEAGSLDVLVEAGANVDAPDRAGWTALHDASAQGSFDAMRALLRHGCSTRALDSEGRAPIHLAAERGHLSATKCLLSAGVDASLRYGNSECSPLDFAAIGGHALVVEAIISHGADVNAAASDGRTALHRAAFFNRAGVVDVLVAAGGADLEARDNGCGWTPLFDASAEGSTDAVAALLRHKAEKNARDREGRTALHLAAQAGRVPAVRALLVAGADHTVRFGDGELSALDVAVHEGNVDVLREIIANGADVEAADSRGTAALHRAAALDEPSVIDALVEAGAGLESRDGGGWTPLFAAAEKGSSDAITALVRHAADHNALDSEGCTPLHIAAEYGHLHAATALLSAGANASFRGFGDDEWSALDVAAVKGHLGVMREIIRRGEGAVNAADSHGYTALHRAAFSDGARAIDVLVQAGADVTATDTAGWTPLHDASAEGSFNAVAALLQGGADQDALDRRGRSPLHLAAEQGCVPTTKHLLSAGADACLRFGKNECSPLDCAIAGGHVDVMQELIRRGGVNVNAADSTGRSPLHRAAFSGQLGAIDVLVGAGASVAALDRNGQTPLDVALSKKSYEAAAALVERGASAVGGGRKGTVVRRNGSPAVSFSLAAGAGVCVGVAKRTFPGKGGKEVNEAIVGDRTAANGARIDRGAMRERSPERAAGVLAERSGSAWAETLWRRRRFLVLCRARPDRVRLLSARREVAAPRGKRDEREDAGDAEGGEEGSARTRPLLWTAARNNARGFAGVVAWLLQLEEQEGLFRRIVRYL